MELNAADLSPIERYKILAGLVFPRPIALVSTRSENGIANCAPYSWFNAVCEDPPLIMISFGPRTDSKTKHSLTNILRSGKPNKNARPRRSADHQGQLLPCA